MTNFNVQNNTSIQRIIDRTEVDQKAHSENKKFIDGQRSTEVLLIVIQSLCSLLKNYIYIYISISIYLYISISISISIYIYICIYKHT